MKKKNKFWTMGFAAALLVLFFVTRYALPGLYVPEWSARHVFWPLAAFIVALALLGYVCPAGFALARYVVGIAAGELLGGWEADVGPQYLHHGWWIMLLVFLAFCGVGFLVRQRGEKRKQR